MILSQMYSKVREGLGDLIQAEPDTTILVRLLRSYQFAVADELHGLLSERDWVFNTIIGTDEYAVPTLLYAPEGSVFRDDIQIDFYTQPKTFWHEFRPQENTQGTPYGALWRPNELGTKVVTLRRHPSAVHEMRFPARWRPEAFTTEIPNETLALATTNATVMEWAGDLHEDEIYNRFATFFNGKIASLQKESLARPRETQKRRSF